MEGAGHRVVIASLVDETVPGLVDDDASGPGAFQSYTATALLTLDGVTRDLHNRNPPRLAHVGQIGAVRHGHPQTVASVVRRGYRAVHGTAQERLHQTGIPFEPAHA